MTTVGEIKKRDDDIPVPIIWYPPPPLRGDNLVANRPKIEFSLSIPSSTNRRNNKLLFTSYTKYKSLAVVFDIIGAVRGEAAIVRSTVRILQVVHCQYIWRVNPIAMYAVFCI